MLRVAGCFTCLMLTVLLAAATVSARMYIVNGAPSPAPPAQGELLPDPGPAAGSELDEEFINFDELPVGGIFGTGIVLTDEYLNQGITFQGEGEALNESGNFGITNYSQPNFLAFNTGAGVYGPETMIFDPPITSMSLFTGHSLSLAITLQAYDSDNSLVDSDQIIGNSVLAEMIVSGDQITRLVISFTGTVLCIDNLTYEQDLAPDPVELHLFPQVTTIPPGGGNVVYDVQLVSVIPQTFPNVFYWTGVTLPNGQSFGPLFQLQFDLVPFMNVFHTGLTQNIPALAPSGQYIFSARVGHMGGMYIEDSFTFQKTGASDTRGFVFDPADWAAGGWVADAGGATAVSVPAKFELTSVYPNPFNATTTVTVTLPEASQLNLAVFNALGQQVAELADSRVAAGWHAYSFAAQDLASGLYFIRATVPGRLDTVGKVMLVR